MLNTMTQTKWDSLSPTERDALRSDAGLSPQLIGLEGWRVEVDDNYGNTRRFYVSRSTGWIPCHIEASRRRSSGGPAADKRYKRVTQLYRR